MVADINMTAVIITAIICVTVVFKLDWIKQQKKVGG